MVWALSEVIKVWTESFTGFKDDNLYYWKSVAPLEYNKSWRKNLSQLAEKEQLTYTPEVSLIDSEEPFYSEERREEEKKGKNSDGGGKQKKNEKNDRPAQ